MVLLAAAGTVAVMNLAPDNQPASPSPSARAATPSESAEAPPTLPPSTLPAAALPLSELGWWNAQQYAFGSVEPMSPDAPPLPDAYKLLRVGTLDGQIVAELRLNPDWSHSSVRGPVGTDVLVANDDGEQTSVYVVSATDGSRTDLFATADLVPSAILSWDGDRVLYVKADRETGADAGLWSRPRAGGAETQLVAGPLGESMGDSLDDITVWWVSLSRDSQTAMVQWCRGEVECRTHLVDIATGAHRLATGAGWPIATTDRLLVAHGTAPNTDQIVVVDLSSAFTRAVANISQVQIIRVGSGWWLAIGGSSLVDLGSGDLPLHSIPDGAPARPGSFLPTSPDKYGQALPDGWMLRWLENVPADPVLIDVPGQLVNIATGESLDIGPFAPFSP